VLREVVITFFKLVAALPGSIVALAGLHKIAEETGFDKSYPDSYQKLSIVINDLLYILIEHWIPYILLCAFLGLIWALLVVEPKSAAKTEFDRRRNQRLGE
jgi:hypothetical protein